MIKDVVETIHWLLRLTIKFFKGAPAATSLMVVLSVVLQGLTMVAFLLPIKVIMLLSSPNIPKFFPDAYSQLGRNTLVLSLGAAAIVCFVLIFFVKHIIKSASHSGASNLQKKAQKISLFPNQNSIASNAYLNHSEMLANVTFSTLAIGLLFYLYTTVAIGLIFYLALLALATNYSSKLHLSLSSHTHHSINNLNDIGFFVVFIFVVFDFLYLSPPSFFIAMFSIIMTRRLLSLLGVSIHKAIVLHRQADKINALFFHHRPLAPTIKVRSGNLWELFDMGLTSPWVKELVSTVADDADLFSVTWLQTHHPHQLVLKVSLRNKGGIFLIKLFDKDFTHLASHEASLLKQYPNSLPCPPLLLTTTISGHSCHLFEITRHEFTTKEKANTSLINLQKPLLSSLPSTQFLQQYKRSKVVLWQRIDSSMFNYLSMVANCDQAGIVERAIKCLPEIILRIKSLPLVVSIPPEGFNRGLLFTCASGEIHCASWENWAFEPIGYGWKTDKRSFSILKAALNQACNSSEQFNDCSIENVMLASLFSEIEKKINLVQYYDVISLLDRALIILKVETR